MKNIISKANKKELFWFLLAPVSFISIFYFSAIIENIIGEPNQIIYLNRFMVFIILIIISIFSVFVFNATKNVCENIKGSIVLTTILIILGIFYIVSFIHPTGQGIFFWEVFMPSLIINIILTYIITLIIKGLNK